MAHVVVIGGGTAGLLMAYELADVVRAGDAVTMVAERAHFRSGGLPPWTPGASPAGMQFPLWSALERHGIALEPSGLAALRAEARRLELRDGKQLAYDFLVIASGPRPAFELVEGLGPYGHTHSICHPDHLPACARGWDALLADPGPVIVGAAEGAPCIGPAYQVTLRIARELERRGLRERAPVTFVTPEPTIGELGCGGLADSRVQLEHALRVAGIDFMANARIRKVERGLMHVSTGPQDATPHRCLLPFRFALVVPRFRGLAGLTTAPGLADDNGFILVDDFLRSSRYPDIYAAGVAVAGDRPAEAHARERRIPHVADGTTSVVAHNISEQLAGRQPLRQAQWRPVCLVTHGASGVAFVEQPQYSESRALGMPGWSYMSSCESCDLAA